MAAAAGGSRYLKEPFDYEHRFIATERIMELQFENVDQRLARIEAMILGVEKRMWMTVFGVVGVILSQAAQSIVAFGTQ